MRCTDAAALPLAVALPAAGQTEEGRAVAEEELAVAERADRPTPRVAALTGLGLTCTGAEQLELLSVAATTVNERCSPLASAGAKVEYGAALRRAGQPVDARRWLRDRWLRDPARDTQSLQLLHRLGGPGWQGLQSRGGRP